MKYPYFILALAVSFFIGCSEKKENNVHEHSDNEPKAEVQQDTIKKSIPKEEHAQIGAAHVMIKYHAPAVRGRAIWGGLVPYGEVWVTGAHSATSIEIDKAFIVNGTEIPAGKYALFTIPDKEKWTIIINKNWDQHLADDYDQKDDVARIVVTPQILNTVQERLKYFITPSNGEESAIQISWEKVKIEFAFKVK